MTEPIWRPAPDEAEQAAVAEFARRVARTHSLELPDYDALWHWSVDHIDDFWRELWQFFDIRASGSREPVLTDRQMPGATWFPEVTLNYVEQVFRDRDPSAVAVVAATEAGVTESLTWAELEARVAAVAATLRGLGVEPGDRVVGYLPNSTAPLIGFLATAGLGAIWSCCGQDYAAGAAANRLAQLGPKVLLAADGYTFAGRVHDRRDEAVALAALLPDATAVVHVRHLGLDPADYALPVTEWADALATPAGALAPLRVPFDHPLWVLYSSGTTGVPKGIVHGHGGVVLEGLKTVALQLGLTGRDRMFWYTTTNWMMWNFNASSLLVGASIVVYDGSPAYPSPDQLWRLVDELEATVVGTSPGYLQACEKQGLTPARDHDLHRLRMIGATGSPLPAASSHWVHEQFAGRVPLVSTSRGTDIVAALAFWAPNVPIWPGEISCGALGVAVDAFDAEGRPVRDAVGELVITEPMPTMPVYLWNDPDGVKYRETYFDVFPGIWRHGDWVTITERGSFVFHGRSDATLNRNGVRLGSADIYEIAERVPGVRDSLVIGVDQPDGRYWMPLFVVLDDGWELDDELRASIASTIRRDASPRHVPDEIIAVPAIPRTRTGKKLEVPVKRILLGARASDVLSLGAVDDPAALESFIELGRARART
jgi:acetoacetyl-CoA synthetase